MARMTPEERAKKKAKCSECGMVKPLTMFYESIWSKHDHQPKCISCQKADQRKYSEQYKERNSQLSEDQIFDGNPDYWCHRCDENKPKTKQYWSINRRRSTGVQTYCRSCMQTLAAERRARIRAQREAEEQDGR